MRANTLTICVLASLGLTLASQAQAEYNPSVYLLPGVTTMDSDGNWHSSKERVGAALRFGKPISEYFDLQAGINQNRTRGDNKYTQTTLGADILLMLSRGQLRPFLLAGAGLERDKLQTQTASSSKNAPFLNAGVGLQAALTEKVFLQGDVRYVYGFLDKGHWGFKRSGNTVLGLSFGYIFDTPVKPAPEPVPALEVKPEPKPEVQAAAEPMPEPVFEKVTLSAAELFAFDRAELQPQQPKLDAMATALSDHPEIEQVRVIGYTDRLGKASYNLKLSQKRAQAVKSYLVSKGIAAERVVAEGRGKANPLQECKGIKGRKALIQCLAPNRRVEIEEVSYKRQVK